MSTACTVLSPFPPSVQAPAAKYGPVAGRCAATGWAIRQATCNDVDDLARIHADSLPGDFLVRLGPAFLKHILFPSLLAAPNTCVYVAERVDGGCGIAPAGVAGLLVTRTALAGVLGDILRCRPLCFAVVASVAITRHPSLLAGVAGVLSQLRTRGSMPSDGRTAELFLMAVDPKARRQGAGRALIRHSAEDLWRIGILSYRVLLHAENAAADSLYRNAGFVERCVHQFGGRSWRERERSLSGPDSVGI